MNNPLLSIVIANYNYGRFLDDAIRSVIGQEGFDQCELIVVDGGSTDDSVEIIKKYADKLAWWCSEKDDGQSDAFNKGFSHASGKYLTWLNADDLLVPGCLKDVLSQMQKHPSCEWFAASSIWCDKNLFVQRVFRAHRFSRRRLWARQLTCGGPSSFFTKRLLESCGGFDVNLHFVMDTDLWYRFALRQGVRYRRIKTLTWVYRIHEESKMSGCGLDPDSERTKRKLMRIREEAALMIDRYGKPCKIAKLINSLPVSIFDALAAWFLQRRYRKLHLSRMCGCLVGRPKVLLSNAIQEYMTGLELVGAEVFAPNNWMRKKFADTECRHFIEESVYGNVQALAEYVEGNGIQILYAQGWRGLRHFTRVRRACFKTKPLLVTNCHAPHVWDCTLKSLALIILAGICADGIVFLVEITRRKWQWLCSLFGLKTWHIPNPVDLQRFPMDVDRRVNRRPAVIGCIGTIEYRKRQDLIVDVVKELVARGERVKASIVGNYVNEGYRSLIEKRILDFGLTDCVELKPTLPYDEVPAWMAGLDLYICPSRAEVMPFSILEAMASGLPAVCHNVAGIHEEVVNGVNGYLIDTENPFDYADAIQSIQGRYGDFSHQARARAEKEFSTVTWAARMCRMLVGAD